MLFILTEPKKGTEVGTIDVHNYAAVIHLRFAFYNFYKLTLGASYVDDRRSDTVALDSPQKSGGFIDLDLQTKWNSSTQQTKSKKGRDE